MKKKFTQPAKGAIQRPGKVSDDAKMQKIYEEIVAKYHKALKKLAEM